MLAFAIVYASSHVSCAFGGAIDLRVHTALSKDMGVAFLQRLEGKLDDELGRRLLILRPLESVHGHGLGLLYLKTTGRPTYTKSLSERKRGCHIKGEGGRGRRWKSGGVINFVIMIFGNKGQPAHISHYKSASSSISVLTCLLHSFLPRLQCPLCSLSALGCRRFKL